MSKYLTVHRRGKVWHYRGTIRGQLLRGSTKVVDKKDAVKIVDRIEAQALQSHTDGPQSVLTFNDAALKYLAAGKAGRFLKPLSSKWKDTLVKDINPGVIRQAAMELYPLASNATRNRHVIVPAQAVINHCADLELCSHIKVKRYKVETKSKKPVDLKWVESFIQAAPQPHLGGLALFMFLTGARISEALRVEWKDVDLQASKALIRDTKTLAQRRAHLPQKLVVAMANIRKTAERTVFRYTTVAAADKEWDKVIERGGLEHFSFHCCRHGFATALLRAGVDVPTVAKLGGWKDPHHVLKTYGHALDDPTLTDRIASTKEAQQVFEIAEIKASAGA